MWDTVALAFLIVGCFIAVPLSAIRMPGNWLIVGLVILSGWLSQWHRFGYWLPITLVVLAILGEVFENLSSAAMAKRAGASKRAMWGGLIGGFVGLFLFTIPLPLIGSTIGALIGCFAGALIAELSVQDSWRQGTRVGTMSVVGFVLGVVAKMMLCFVMCALVVGVLTHYWLMG
jgi:uncharacterized protein YqgC (DUF456 family)